MSWNSKDWMRLVGGLAAATAIAGSGGALGPGFAALLGAGGGAGAGAGAAGAAGAGAALPTALAGGAGSAAGATAGALGAGAAGTAAASPGFAALLGASPVGKAAMGAALTSGISAATPQKGMTTPGNVPPMQAEDPMIALQQLMEQAKRRGRAI